MFLSLCVSRRGIWNQLGGRAALLLLPLRAPLVQLTPCFTGLWGGCAGCLSRLPPPRQSSLIARRWSLTANKRRPVSCRSRSDSKTEIDSKSGGLQKPLSSGETWLQQATSRNLSTTQHSAELSLQPWEKQNGCQWLASSFFSGEISTQAHLFPESPSNSPCSSLQLPQVG